MSNTILFSDPRFLNHDPGAGHPESPARLRAILASLQAHPIPGTSWASPRLATETELATVHAPAYLADLEARAGKRAQLDPDTVMSPGSWDAARLAAGASLQAVEEVWAGRADNAFVLCRPPGHHAERGRAMGFCLLNNAALAAEMALHLGATRVAVLDWDVHHGNGTQHLFESRRDVLYLSAHQYPFYPGTGAAHEIGRGEGMGFTVNVPLPPGQTDADYGALFGDLVLPALDNFAPDLVIVSAGFDAHVRDPLAEMNVTERGFAAMCSSVAQVNSKLVLLLEGGYDEAGLAGSVHACVRVLAGDRDTFPGGAGAAASSAIAAVRGAHAVIGRPLLRRSMA